MSFPTALIITELHQLLTTCSAACCSGGFGLRPHVGAPTCMQCTWLQMAVPGMRRWQLACPGRVCRKSPLRPCSHAAVHAQRMQSHLVLLMLMLTLMLMLMLQQLHCGQLLVLRVQCMLRLLLCNSLSALRLR